MEGASAAFRDGDDVNATTAIQSISFSPSSPSESTLLPSIDNATVAPTTLTEYYFDGTSLSQAQEKALVLIPIFTGALSAWGSAQIIFMVYRMPQRSRNCYNRIMLGLSCSDFVSSTVLSLQAFLLPADSSNRIWAVGTDGTCSLMGFIQQLSMTSILYCGMLSWMYVLAIKYSIPDKTLSRNYEPYMHSVSIVFPLVGAIVGVALGLFNELAIGSFCWFSGTDEEASFLKPTVLCGYIFGGIPGIVVFGAVIINNLRVYCHLRQTLQQQPVVDTDNGQIVSSGPNPVLFKDLAAGDPLASGRSHRSTESKESHQTSANNSAESSAESGVTTFSNESIGDVELQELRREEIREMQREQQRLQSLQNRQKSQIKAVAYQAFFYVAAFLITYLPTFILRPMAVYLTQSQEASVFPLLLLQAIFWPLQGLFNYLIYSRSPTSYLREIT